MDEINENLLKHIYYDNENFVGSDKLYKLAKKYSTTITLKFVKKWLAKQSIHQQKNTKVGKKRYLPIYSEVPFSFQCDLTFFPQFKKQNKGYYVLFTMININTRFVYAEAMKGQNKNDIIEVFEKMLEKTEINNITCDLQFSVISKWCEKNDIQLHLINAKEEGGNKLGKINRFHRTMKERFKDYFEHRGTVEWYSYYPKLIKNYNETPHSSLEGLAPKEINGFIEEMIIQKDQIKTEKLEEEDDLVIGDMVRIFVKKDDYGKKSLSSYYSKDLYKIIKVSKNSVIVKKDGGKDIRMNKKNVKKVDEVEGISNDTLEKALKSHRQKLKLKRLLG